MATDGKEQLDDAVDDLEREIPPKATRWVEWARSDRARRVRIPLALALMGAGFFGLFLPVIGIELVPFALVLLAYDVPFLRKPMAHLLEKLLRGWRRLKEWRHKQ